MHGISQAGLLAFVLGGIVSAAGAVETAPPVRHQLEVETNRGQVRVRLLVENRSSATIYIPREIAAEDALTGRRFEIVDSTGKPVAYVGRMVKRGALTGADWQAVKAGSLHAHTIDVTPAYAFWKGKFAYEIRYDGPYLVDVTQPEAVQHSPAAPVKFQFSK